jgi:hypothetical protein
MTPSTALRKSIVLIPVEAALKRSSTKDELDDAWFIYCDSYADESPERVYLRGVYDECARRIDVQFQAAEAVARALRV